MRNSTLKVISTGICAVYLAAAMSGCVVKNLGQTVQQTVKGDYFLQSDQAKRGRESFRVEVEQHPDSALAHYYYGRFLLQDKEEALALEHLVKARDLDPGKADYHFWAGVAYGASGDLVREENNYRAALGLDKDHLQTLIYLGHNQLAQKKYPEALQLYQRAIDLWPSSPSALYNRALILNQLGRTPEERIAWLDYLDRYPSGQNARRAADYLNMAGDFSFRNHRLGSTIVTIEKIRFVPFTAIVDPASHASLSLIGEVFQDMKKGVLQIVVYQKNNKGLAKERAHAVKSFISAEYPSIDTGRIGISWFAEPQHLTIGSEKASLDESVLFFVTQ